MSTTTDPQYQVGEFTIVPGWFVYSETEHNPHHFSAVGDNFGLEPTQSWSSLVKFLHSKNEEQLKSNSPIRYKLVFAARHGEGWHNVAETKYSTAEWDAKWAVLTGDGEITWGPDPELTPLGESQARDVHAAWEKQLQAKEQGKDHAPLPTRLFSSPFKRSCKTLQLSYEGILLPRLTPLIKEDLREQYGDDHEAVHRSTKSTIQKNFPQYDIEDGFTENDERFKVSSVGMTATTTPLILEGFRENFRDLHTCDQRSDKRTIEEYLPGWEFGTGFKENDELFGKIHETVDQMTFRVARALRDVFQIANKDDVIHISSHSGVMESLWRVTGHEPFKPATGAIVPMVVKWDPTQHVDQ